MGVLKEIVEGWGDPTPISGRSCCSLLPSSSSPPSALLASTKPRAPETSHLCEVGGPGTFWGPLWSASWTTSPWLLKSQHWASGGVGRIPPCNCSLKLGDKKEHQSSYPILMNSQPSVFSRTLHNDAASRVAPDTMPGSEAPGSQAEAGTPQGGSPGSPRVHWKSQDMLALENSTEELNKSTMVQGNWAEELSRATLLDWASSEPALSPGLVGLEAVGEEL